MSKDTKAYLLKTKHPSWMLFVVLGLVTVAFLVFVIDGRPLATQVGNYQTEQQTLSDLSPEDLTAQLLAKTEEWRKAQGKQKAELARQLRDIAQTRKEKLSALIEDDTSRAMKTGIAKEVRTKLPQEVQEKIEEEVNLEGLFETVDFDDPQLNTLLRLYFLQVGNKRFSLFTSDAVPQIISGSKVRVKGLRLDNKIAFDMNGTLEVLEEATPDALGEQKTAVILFNFQSNTSQACGMKPDYPQNTCTVEDVEGVFFTNPDSFSAFLYEASYQSAWATGDVFGWYTLPIEPTCDTRQFLPALVSAADSQIYFPDYKRVVFVFPFEGTPCGWMAGFSTTGIADETNIFGYTFPDGDVNASYTWLSAAYLNFGLARHELGHALGVGHADTLNCGAEAIPKDFSTCNSYNDPFGSGFTPVQKEKLSWFTSSDITEATASGRYTLAPFEAATSSPKVIKIRRPDVPYDIIGKRFYYLTFNPQPSPLSGFFEGNNSDKGILIHTSYERGIVDSFLIDTTPDSRTDEGFADGVDGALEAGRSVTDPLLNITITTESVSSGEAVVNITFGPIDTSTPSVSITSPPEGSNFDACPNTRIGVDAIAEDPEVGIAKVEFLADDQKYYTDFTYPYTANWNTYSLPPPSSVQFSAKAYNKLGLWAVDSVSVNFTGASLSAAITQPVADSIQFGKANISVETHGCLGGYQVNLLDGSGRLIKAIKTGFLDYVPIPPLSFKWDTQGEPDGDYVLVAKVWNTDFSQELESARVPIRIANNADSDNDGFSNFKESFMGTDPLLACGVNAWPPDFNDDGVVHIEDVTVISGRFGAKVGDPKYSPRYEVASQDGVIHIDDVTKIADAFGISCNAP